jgi:wobble nucleotide-excising tRNase
VCRFEKIKAAKVAAHRRHFLRMQSERDALKYECEELEREIQDEKLKLSNISAEVRNMEKAR